MIAPKQFDQTSYEYHLAISNYDLALQEQLTQWEMDVYQYKNEVDQNSAKIEQLGKERKRYYLTSPISGVVQQYSGVRVGSFVYANQKIAEISSDSSLIAELYESDSFTGSSIRRKDYPIWGMDIL